MSSSSKRIFTTEDELKKLYEYAAMHCTITEMAHIFGCSRDVFYQRPDLMEIIEKAKNETKSKIRTRMIQRALYDGNDEFFLNLSQRALEWVSKWYLDQRDTAIKESEDTQNTFLPPAATLDDKAS